MSNVTTPNAKMPNMTTPNMTTPNMTQSRQCSLAPLALAALVALAVGQWFIWADAGTGLALALRLFLEGRTLGKGTALQAACGGCGGG